MSRGVIIFLILMVLGLTVEAFLILNHGNLPVLRLQNYSTTRIIPTILPDPNKKPSHDISLTDSGFEPNNITIAPGEKIVWTNKSGQNAELSDVNARTNPLLNLGLFKPGESLRMIFPAPGTFMYQNNLNPSQKGTITVQ